MSREKFEKLPEVARLVICDEIKWCDVYNWYRTDNTDANSIYYVAWLNGAWYIFQEQQKKIDEFVNIIHDAYMSVGNSSVEDVYDKIQELLK